MVYRSRYGPKKKQIFGKSLYWYIVFYCLFWGKKNSCEVYGFNAIVTSFRNGVPWWQWWCILFTEAIFFESRVSVFYYATEYTAKHKLSFWTLMSYLLEGKTRKRTWFVSEKLKDTSFSLEVTVSTSTQEIYGVRLYLLRHTHTHTHMQKNTYYCCRL